MEIFYLHGLASSPGSGKARFLGERLREHGWDLRCPDLNLPDFSTLTTTRMLDQVERAIDARPPGPVALIGSSLGGFVALHAAARRASRLDDRHPITHLVLFAPALDFGWTRDPLAVPANIQAWRDTDRWEPFHHAYGRHVPVHFQLWEDAGQYDSLAVRVEVPTLIFHGTRDTVVAMRSVERFAEGRPNVTVRRLDDDHQLQGHLDEAWEEIRRFLPIGTGGVSTSSR
ncbi:MAG TPA: YqiA/YcfP family alpha/beta fold hydrolase [Vicinamibacterales bacterium]|nr:YqiA/YcfP family alpha/beta fold hydrolase [Vicinamibacterales bacterium]